jgi:hypothetical protein
MSQSDECFVRIMSDVNVNIWMPARQHHRDALLSYLNTPVPIYGFHTSPLEVSVDHEDGGVYEVTFTQTRPTRMNCWFIENETGRELTVMLCPLAYAEFQNARIRQMM